MEPQREEKKPPDPEKKESSEIVPKTEFNPEWGVGDVSSSQRETTEKNFAVLKIYGLLKNSSDETDIIKSLLTPQLFFIGNVQKFQVPLVILLKRENITQILLKINMIAI